MNYKEQDRKKLLDYLLEMGTEVPVEDLVKKAGVTKLRLYPILFELEQQGLIRRTKTSLWGAIEALVLCK